MKADPRREVFRTIARQQVSGAELFRKGEAAVDELVERMVQNDDARTAQAATEAAEARDIKVQVPAAVAVAKQMGVSPAGAVQRIVDESAAAEPVATSAAVAIPYHRPRDRAPAAP